MIAVQSELAQRLSQAARDLELTSHDLAMLTGIQWERMCVIIAYNEEPTPEEYDLILHILQATEDSWAVLERYNLPLP